MSENLETIARGYSCLHNVLPLATCALHNAGSNPLATRLAKRIPRVSANPTDAILFRQRRGVATRGQDVSCTYLREYTHPQPSRAKNRHHQKRKPLT